MKPFAIAKRFAAFGVFATTLLHASSSRADDALPKGVVVVDEGGDAWLHDHCSFRGAKAFASEDATPAGAVVTLQYTRAKGLFGSELVVKTFRCAERPPFALMAWTPAPQNEVMCVDVKTSCARPFLATPPKPAALSAAAKVESLVVTPPKAEVKTPPAMPAPPRPRWAKKRAKEPSTSGARGAVDVRRDMGPGY